jgi:Fe-S oxidoreductase
MVLCYRDEYVKTLGAVGGDVKVLLVQEWLLTVPVATLSGHVTDTVIAEPITMTDATASGVSALPWYLLAHCTEKTAHITTHDEWVTLFGRAGATLLPVAVGCCGMAGTYGHDAAQQVHSKGIYGLSWAEPLAQLPKERCLATGYSCRSQVKRMDGATLKHPLQALLTLLK